MKRQAYSIMAAALLLASGALLTTACSNEDTAIDNPISTVGSGQTIQFTATLAPKSGDGTTTRAIKKGKDGDKEILNVAWEADEEIAIYYETTNGHKTTTATVQTVDDKTGEATISATFDADAKNNGTANFVFPASLHNNTGGIDESQLLTKQRGILTYSGTGSDYSISKNFDAATAEATVTVSGSEATVSGTVAMQNSVCILKITLGFDDGQSHTIIDPLQGGNTLTIAVADGPTYTITSAFGDTEAAVAVGGSTPTRPFQTDDVIYVAMLPVDSRDVIFLSPASDNKRYEKKSTGVTLEKGKFYRNVNVWLTEVQLPAGEKDLSAGSITAEDGDRIIQSIGTSTANTITIPNGATVTLAGVNISATETAGIICKGTANIILSGTNTVMTTNWNYSSIQAGGRGTMLTISGSGSLTATSDIGAGIGSGQDAYCGNITITGGTVTATGGYGAGIGSGRDGSCGNITITGGTVTAKGGNGAGIGSGSGDSGSCGNITITGGTVTATGDEGAGIGSGESGSCGNITITDGVSSVTAKKDVADCSIGRGYNGSCGKVTIGGTVYYDNSKYTSDAAETYLQQNEIVYPAP